MLIWTDLFKIRNMCAARPRSRHTPSGKYERETYLPLRQVSEAGHGGQTAEDPMELGVLGHLEEGGRVCQ